MCIRDRVLMEKVYGDSETTCQNIASLMKNSRSSQAVTLAVDVYKRQEQSFLIVEKFQIFGYAAGNRILLHRTLKRKLLSSIHIRERQRRQPDLCSPAAIQGAVIRQRVLDVYKRQPCGRSDGQADPAVRRHQQRDRLAL